MGACLHTFEVCMTKIFGTHISIVYAVESIYFNY